MLRTQSFSVALTPSEKQTKKVSSESRLTLFSFCVKFLEGVRRNPILQKGTSAFSFPYSLSLVCDTRVFDALY